MSAETLDLDAIRTRLAHAWEPAPDADTWANRLYASSEDIPALLAEVERLNAERDRIQDVRRLTLKPGDTLVFEADRPLTPWECDTQAAAIKAAFPDHHVMVVDQGHFAVIEAANLTREQRDVIADPGT